MSASCTVCGSTPPENPYKGVPSRCRECHKESVRKNRLNKVEYYRAYDRGRGNRQPPGYVRQYRNGNPVKYKAVTMVGNAVRDGKLTKPDACEECGDAGRLHGHHDDYAYPLRVRWLCSACHNSWHVRHGEGLNG